MRRVSVSVYFETDREPPVDEILAAADRLARDLGGGLTATQVDLDWDRGDDAPEEPGR